MEKMELEYMDSAKEKKVYIVNCCGFDSVPADEGMAFTKEQFHYCAFAEARPTSCHCISHVTLGHCPTAIQTGTRYSFHGL